MFGRNKIAMIMAEFVGTGVLTAVVLAVGSSPAYNYAPFFVSLAAGTVLLAMTLVLGRVSGAHLNPAITIGLWSTRVIKTMPALVYIAAQLLGAVCTYLLYTYLVDSGIANEHKFDSRILVAEAVGAFIFSLGWAATVYQKMQPMMAAVTVSSSLVLGIFVASLASAGLLNPAVALGTQNWAWGTYILGPVLGAIIGFNLYALLFAPSAALAAAEARAEGDSTPTAKRKKK